MGKKIGWLIVVLFLATSLFYFIRQKQHPSEPTSMVSTRTPSTTVIPQETAPPNKVSTSIFVPAWAIDQANLKLGSYDRVIYFGITAATKGINKYDQGYQNLTAFAKATADKEKYLALTMTNSETNNAVLVDNKAQQKIISQTIDIAKQNGFFGLVLDFELFSLFNDKVPGEINQFVQSFYNQAKGSNLKFTVTIYGDTFYRKRPYDLKTIGQNCDEIMIMAYDFSKSGGEPGPNFPLAGREKFGYDLKTMIDDFSSLVPKNKLTVIFGMYGYDWIVDSNRHPIKPAQSLSDQKIQQQYLSQCSSKNCVVLHDPQTKETEVDFVHYLGLDQNNFAQEETHVVWFEDQNSAAAKQDYLKKQGITSYSYWAYDYFQS